MNNEYYIPPPNKADRLLDLDPINWKSNACLSHAHHDGEYAYAEGYRRAAQELIRSVENGNTDQDFFVYPIVFLYRHHIELAFKALIRRSAAMIRRPLTEAESRCASGSHDLQKLWEVLAPRLRDMTTAGAICFDDALQEAVSSYIDQLTQIDPISTAFRYPLSKDGQPSLSDSLKVINLSHFGQLMEQLANILDGINCAIDSILDAYSSY